MRVVLSMDGEGFGSDALRSEASNWYFPSFYILWNDEWRIITDGNREVYRDAFAPPAPSRRVKPWERAPVPAHAPRLQGQKVWKKVGLKAY